MSSQASNRMASAALLLFALILGSCHVRINPLLERIDELRLAGIKVYSGDELSESEKETLVEEFHTVDVSFFRVQERRDALLELYQKRSRIQKKKLAERRRRVIANDSQLDSFSGAPLDREYWSRRRARGRKD